jgi:hypothetical protein
MEDLMDIKKCFCLKISVLVFVILLLQVNGLATVKANWSPIAFQEAARAANVGSAINQYVVEGAGHFLKSHATILDFLNKIELNDLNGADFIELQNLIDTAIFHMENARLAYADLTQLAEVTPYNPDVIAALRTFNYGKFRHDNELNFEIFWKVRSYLKRGDVRGVYRKMLRETEGILNILNDIKTEVYANEIPEISLIWNLNHRCFLSLISDQYTSMVFYEIH